MQHSSESKSSRLLITSEGKNAGREYNIAENRNGFGYEDRNGDKYGKDVFTTMKQVMLYFYMVDLLYFQETTHDPKYLTHISQYRGNDNVPFICL